MAGPSRAAAHALVRGRVQGVGFRAWVERTARRLGLDGWVCNRPDGSVEAAFAGPPPAVAEMLKALAAGPASARVDAVERVADPDPASLKPGFEVRR